MTKILYSPGYGAGWSTWNGDNLRKMMLTWQPIINALEAGEEITESHPAVVSLQDAAKREHDEDYVCVLGADQLCIAEVSGPFRINEYDGSESVVEGMPDYISI